MGQFVMRLALGSALVAILFGSWAVAGPQGEHVIRGNVRFEHAGNTTIIYASNKAIVNYSSFNIGRSEIVRFVQPNRTSTVLNRVNSAAPTQIDGAVQANGVVYIVNRAGVNFGPTSVVSAAGIYAAAASITNADFVAGLNRFTNSGGDVTNSGRIVADAATLVGRHVSNFGSIVADSGLVTMVAGTDVLLSEGLGGHVMVRIEGAAPDATGKPGVQNTGTIQADKGKVLMGAGDMFSIAAQNAGTIKAGQIAIQGAGKGDVVNTGTLDATGKAGGKVSLFGQRVGQFGTVRADGTEGSGGDVEITAMDLVVLGVGSLTAANAGPLGDGGRVHVWSDNNLDFQAGARIEARGGITGGNGGFIETSSDGGIRLAGSVDVSAPAGTAGTWLIDPKFVDVIPGAGDQDATFTGGGNQLLWTDADTANNTLGEATIEGVAAGTVIIEATEDGAGTGAVTFKPGAGWAGGNITLQSGVSLAIHAGGTISANGAGAATTIINVSGGGGITLTADAAVGAGGANHNGVGNCDLTNMTLNVTTGAGNIALAGQNIVLGPATISGPGHLTAAAGGAITVASGTITTGLVVNTLSAGGGTGIGTDAARISFTGGGMSLDATATAGGIFITHATGSVQYGSAAPITAPGAIGLYSTSNGQALTVSQDVQSTGSTVTIGAAGGMGVSANPWANTTLTISAGSDGAGNLIIGGVTMQGSTIALRAGSGSGSSSVSLNGAVVIVGGAGAGTSPAVFTIRQDAAITDATLPAASRFGAAPPATYNLQSDTGGVTLNVSSKIAGSTVTITGAATGQAYQINTAAAGQAGIITINAGAGNDTFIINSAAGTGMPAGGVTFNGGGGSDTVTGADVANTWNITANNAGNVAGTVPFAFSGAANLVGGSNTDAFVFSDTFGVSGTINGGGGANTLNWAAYTTAVSVNLQTSAATGVKGGAAAGFSNIQTFTGGSASDTLTGPDVANTWAITSNNGGTVAGMTFSSMENLVGGSNTDAFVLSDTFGVSGTINGGGGSNTLNWAAYGTGVNVNLQASTGTGVGGGFSNIQTFTGGASGSDTLTGPNAANTWAITANNGGTVAGATFSSFESLIGGSNTDAFVFSDTRTISSTINGGGGNDTLNWAAYSGAVTVNLQTLAATGINGGAAAGFSSIEVFTGGAGNNGLTGPNAANTWAITSNNAGTVAGKAFSSFEYLVGGNVTDHFVFSDGVSVSGTIAAISGAGNALDWSAYTAPVAVNLETRTATGINGGGAAAFINIQAFTGGSAGNTLTGPNAANTWAITSNNGGTVAGTTFTAFGNLVGGTSTDAFVFSNGFGVTGTINGTGAAGNTLDWSAYNTAVTVNLQTSAATGINGGAAAGFSNIQTFTGGSASDTLTGPDAANTWAITSNNGGTVAGMAFTAFENLVGGSGTDAFVFSNGFGVTGTINGTGAAGNTLNWSAYNTAVTVNFQTSAATGVAGGFSNIQTFTGGSASDTLTGPNAANTWAITSNNGGTVAGMAFTAFENLVGGTGTDAFVFSNGFGVTGTINGTGAAGNTLDWSAYNTAVTANLQTGAATGVGGGFSNIQTLTGGSASDTLTGPNLANTWAITANNGGTVAGATFSSFENLVGGTNTDAFVFSNGFSVSGTINGTGAAGNTLDWSAYNTPVTVNLQTSAATGINGGAAAGFSNIQAVTGGSGSNTMTGPDVANTWAITSNNGGTVAGVTFTAFGNLAGGSNTDSFVFSDTRTISGTINGGGNTDTLNWSAYTAAVTVNLQTSAATGINGGAAGGFSSIEALIGGSGSNVLTGPDVANTWHIALAGGTVGAVGFTSFSTLNGGSNNDALTIDFSGGYNVPAGGLTFNGNGQVGSDSITLTGSSPAQVTHTFIDNASGTIFVTGSGLITYGTMESITDSLTPTGRMFTYGGTVGPVANVITVNNAGVAHNGTSQITTAGPVQNVPTTFTNPTGLLTIDAGAGGDTMSVAPDDVGVTVYAGALHLKTTDALAIGGVTTNGIIRVNSGGAVTQSGAVTGTELGVYSGGAITLTSANHLATFAAESTLSGAAIQYTDVDALSVGTVVDAGGFIGHDLVGITTTGVGNVTITVGGSLTLTNLINAPGATVTLVTTTNNLDIVDGSTPATATDVTANHLVVDTVGSNGTVGTAADPIEFQGSSINSAGVANQSNVHINIVNVDLTLDATLTGGVISGSFQNSGPFNIVIDGGNAPVVMADDSSLTTATGTIQFINTTSLAINDSLLQTTGGAITINAGVIQLINGAGVTTTTPTLLTSGAGVIGIIGTTFTMGAGLIQTTGTGAINVTTTAGAAAFDGGLVHASGTGVITVTAAGNVTDTGATPKFQGPTLVINTTGGVGAIGDPLNTQVSNLSVRAAGGDIFIQNTGPLTLVSGGAGAPFTGNSVMASAGGSIKAGSPLTIAAPAVHAASFTYQAGDNNSATADDLTINAAVTLTSAVNSTLAFVAGDSVVLQGAGVVTTGGGGTHTVVMWADHEGALDATRGQITQAAGSSVQTNTLLLGAFGPITMVQPGNSVATIAATLTGAGQAMEYTNGAGSLTIGSGSFPDPDLGAPLAPTGIVTQDAGVFLRSAAALAVDDVINTNPVVNNPVVRLRADGAITEGAFGAITATSLGALSGGAITLMQSNAVGTFAAQSTLAAAAIQFTAAGALDVNTVADSGGFFGSNLIGVVANNGAITVVSNGNMTVTQLVNAGTSTAALTSQIGSINGPAATDVQAGTSVTLNAATGIGNTAVMDLATPSVLAVTTAGNIDIANTSAVAVAIMGLTSNGGAIVYNQTGGGSLDIAAAGIGVNSGVAGANGGQIDITTDGSFSINKLITSAAGAGGTLTLIGVSVVNVAPVSGQGNITLTGASVDTIIAANIIQATPITITASRDIIVQATLQTTAATDILLTADSDNNGTGGVWVQAAGLVDSGRHIVVTGSALDAAGGGGNAILIDADGANNQVLAAGNITLTYQPAAVPLPASDVVINGIVRSSGAGAVDVAANRSILMGATGLIDAGAGPLTLNAVTATAGTVGSPLHTAVGTLVVTNATNLFVNELDNLNVGPVNVALAGTASVVVNGDVSVIGNVTGGTVLLQAGADGTGGLSFTAGPWTVRGDSITLRAGNGGAAFGTVDALTNAPLFRNAAGTANPTAFVIRQGPSLGDALTPAAAQFFGGTPAGVAYTLQSDAFNVVVTDASKFVGTSLTLIATTANINVLVPVGTGLGNALIDATFTAAAGILEMTGVTTTGPQTYTAISIRPQGTYTATGTAGSDTIRFAGQVVVMGDTVVNGGGLVGDNVVFTGAVNGPHSLTLAAGAGIVDMQGDVNISGGATAFTVVSSATTDLQNVVVAAGGIDVTGTTAINLNGTAYTSGAGGDIRFNGPVTLAAGPIVVTGGTALTDNVTFTNTVNGARALTITAGGNVAMQDVVGGGTALLSTNFTAGATLSLLSVTTTGSQTYAGAAISVAGAYTATGTAGSDPIQFTGPVTLTADTTVTGGGLANDPVTFTSTITGAHALDIEAALGAVALQGNVGVPTALTALTVVGGTVTTADLTTAGPVAITASGVLTTGNITATGGTVTVIANGGATMGDVTTTGGTVDVTTLSALSIGNITTTAGVNTGTASGAVTLAVNAAGNLALTGDVVTTGAANAGGTGSDGGAITMTTFDGTIQTLNLTSTGGAGTDGGAGGAVHVESRTASNGNGKCRVTIVGEVNSQGGAGSAGDGGAGGNITLWAQGGPVAQVLPPAVPPITLGGTVLVYGDPVTGDCLRADGGPGSVTGGAGGDISLRAQSTEFSAKLVQTLHDFRPFGVIELGNMAAGVNVTVSSLGGTGPTDGAAGQVLLGAVNPAAFATDGRANIPSVATIVGKVATGNTLIIRGGNVYMARNEKLTSLGSVTITGSDLVLGDVTAKDDIVIFGSDQVTFRWRQTALVLVTATKLVPDRGTDYVGGTVDVTTGGGGIFTYIDEIGGTGFNETRPRRAIVGGGGSFPTSATERGGVTVQALGATQILGTAINVTVLDPVVGFPDGTTTVAQDVLASQGVFPSLATALASALPSQNVTVPDVSTQISGEERLDLVRHLGIYTRDVTDAELVEWLEGWRFISDAPQFDHIVSAGDWFGAGAGSPSQYKVLIDRLPNDAARDAMAAYREIYWRQTVDKDGKKTWASVAGGIKNLLQKSVDAYLAKNNGKFDPVGYRKYLHQATLAAFNASHTGKFDQAAYNTWLAERNFKGYEAAHNGQFDPADYWKWVVDKGDVSKESEYVMLGIAKLFRKVELLGLGPVELSISQQTLARPVKPRGLELQQLIDAVNNVPSRPEGIVAAQ